jgi:hypothetical protein
VSPPDKVIEPGEPATIAAAGLSRFSIYQTSGGSTSYFGYGQGTYDAYDAIYWANSTASRMALASISPWITMRSTTT